MCRGKIEGSGGVKRCNRVYFLIALLVMGLLTFGFHQRVPAAEKGPIKVGFTASLTGNFGQFGKDMLDGFKMYLDEINYTAGGRKIELFVEDEQESPAVAVTKTRKLITHDRVHFITGVFLTSVAYAMADVCCKAKMPIFVAISGGDDITQRKHCRYVVRMSYTGSELGHVAGDYAYKKLGWRKASSVAFDYGWGHENAGAFHRVFEELGGKVIQKIWTPIAAVDFGPYVANLNPEADGIFDCVTGAASIRLLRDIYESGRKWTVIGPGPITDETFHEALGQYGIGIYSTMPYSVALQNSENTKFRERARKIRNGLEPTTFFATVYRAADVIFKAVEAVKGNVEDKERFLDVVRSTEIPNSIAGPFKIDKYGHPIQNVYVRRMEKVDGGYQNTVVETYANATQIWKYDPEKYLKDPIYSRDFPPCKNCR
jgi:branched-chain amino acid transport system substrate-binding protein